MQELSSNEMYEINGGKITVDINELVRQLNPYEIGKSFGRNVVHPYVWTPAKNLYNKIFR